MAAPHDSTPHSLSLVPAASAAHLAPSTTTRPKSHPLHLRTLATLARLYKYAQTTATVMSSPCLDRFLSKGRKLVPFLKPRPISPVGTKDQTAPLLARLPPELLWLIWDLYFRGYAVHPYVEGERLRAGECRARLADDDPRDPHYESCGHKSVPYDCVPLLLTCKKIYFECIDTLYHKTVFDFSHAPGSLAYIPKRLPAHHVALISQVNITYMLYHPLYLKSKKPSKAAALWVGTWEALAAMEGLEWLRYALTISAPHVAPEYTGQEWTLWEGVRKVTRPSHFELILPFPAAESTREETLPCTVIRRVEERRLPPVH